MEMIAPLAKSIGSHSQRRVNRPFSPTATVLVSRHRPGGSERCLLVKLVRNFSLAPRTSTVGRVFSIECSDSNLIQLWIHHLKKARVAVNRQLDCAWPAAATATTKTTTTAATAIRLTQATQLTPFLCKRVSLFLA